MKPVHFFYSGLWLAAGCYVWLSGPWRDASSLSDSGPHDAMFHMHQPLHQGGKVAMVGQFHLELSSQSDGTHRLWISNARREELKVDDFEGHLQIEAEGGNTVEVPFARSGSDRELIARSEPLAGQVRLNVTGKLGQSAAFDRVSFFWDFDPDFHLPTPLGLDPMVPVPSDNPLSAEKVKLGRELFHDARLSADGSVSCASCHRPEHAFAEPTAVAKGVGGRLGRRNTPTVLNSAYLTSLFWDGRTASLEEQAIAPILAHDEMGITNVPSLLETLRPDYEDRMRAAFGRPLSLHTIGMSIASYERTLFSGDSDFDRFEAGDRDAISVSALRGRHLFFGKARCGDCHVPPLFTDMKFHNLGVGWTEDGSGDRGRFEATGIEEHRGAFRTPSLRDVAKTAPYMHDGSLPTLRAVVEFYNRGCRPNPGVSPRVGPLDLNAREIDDLVALLKTLNGRLQSDSVTVSGNTREPWHNRIATTASMWHVGD